MVDEKALYAAATAALNARRKANGWPATTLDKMLTPDRDAWIEDVQAAITAYLQALSPGSTGEAEGWVLVPKEPTLAMSDRAQELISLTQQAGWHGAHPLAIYRAMLAAAPAPPSAMLSAAGER